MSRIKIIILILIVAVLSIVFIQNRDPIALKFLCGSDSNAFCPQSIPLPLAVWIGLFTFTGAILGSLIQALNRYGYHRSGRKSVTFDEELYSSRREWQSSANRRDRATDSSPGLQDVSDQDHSATSSFEVKQEPQNIERSGSTYSYKYREASEKQNNNHDSIRSTSRDPEIDSNGTQDDNDEDWI